VAYACVFAFTKWRVNNRHTAKRLLSFHACDLIQKEAGKTRRTANRLLSFTHIHAHTKKVIKTRRTAKQFAILLCTRSRIQKGHKKGAALPNSLLSFTHTRPRAETSRKKKKTAAPQNLCYLSLTYATLCRNKSQKKEPHRKPFVIFHSHTRLHTKRSHKNSAHCQPFAILLCTRSRIQKGHKNSAHCKPFAIFYAYATSCRNKSQKRSRIANRLPSFTHIHARIQKSRKKGAAL
jgi:hypothetical protein